MDDAEIVARLQLIQECGGNTREAGRRLHISPGTISHTISLAKQRGLTAASRIKDPLAQATAKVKTLEARVRDLERQDDTAESIRREIWKIAEFSPDPPAWLTKEGKNGFRGMPFLLASDWHYGEVVRPEEVGGTNEFNAEIAVKRIKRMVNTTVDLCFNHMGKAKTVYPGIVFALGGDMISGDIHEELAVTNDRTPQQCINDLTDHIGACVETFASRFGKVFVPCVTGNHGRNTRKPRYKGRVWTSHEWNIYCNLERLFRRDKNIVFAIPNETDIRFNVYGHRYLLTHGDNLGVKGGDGIIGALGPIRRGEIKIRNAESQIDRDFDTIVMGHWHQAIFLPGLIVNNSLKGYDEYARLALRAPWSRPSQQLWFTHPEHGVTAYWQVFLEDVKHAKPNPPVLEWRA